jgi:drug/metabolite transporter (DMT)-like permease
MGISLVVQSMPPLMGAGTRFLAGALLLGLIVLAIRGPRVFRFTFPELRGAVFMGLFILTIGIGMLSLAQRYVPSSIAALIVSVIPLWIVIFRIRAGDRPSKLTLTGVGIGLLGLILLLLPGGTAPVGNAGLLQVALWSCGIAVSSFLWAFFSWKSTSYAQPKDSLVTTVIELSTAGVVLTIMGAVIGERWDLDAVTSASWFGWGFLVLASAVAYSAYVWLIGNAPMSLVSTYAYVNPVIAVILGFMILNEPFTYDVALGLTVVVGGVILVVSGERRAKLIVPEPG